MGHVILSTAKNLRVASEILRGAQNDRFWNWVVQKTSLCKTRKGYSYYGRTRCRRGLGVHSRGAATLSGGQVIGG
nr:hypothetical protein [Ktedonobacteraceae bacterium]